MNKAIVLECRQLAKTYHDGQLHIEVFKNLNLHVEAGEQIAIMGCSGAGKSTLLHLLGGLEQPTQGDILLAGVPFKTLTAKQASQMRNEKLGFIYQLHHLLPEFTVLENVCLPMLLGHEPISLIRERAIDLLQRVGLGQRLMHKISELSGGERQRTAIVRALVHYPLCVLADEPTGNLDPLTASKVYDTLLMLNRELNISFVIVTHDLTIARKMDRVLTLRDGQLLPGVIQE